MPRLNSVIKKDCDKNTSSSFFIFNLLDNYSAINSEIETNKKMGLLWSLLLDVSSQLRALATFKPKTPFPPFTPNKIKSICT